MPNFLALNIYREENNFSWTLITELHGHFHKSSDYSE